MTPEVLVGMLAELEKIRSLTIDLVERQAPHLVPAIDPPPPTPNTPPTICYSALAAPSSGTRRQPATYTICW